MMVKNEGELPLLGKLGGDASVSWNLGIEPLNDLCLYIFSEKDIHLMI